MMKSIKVFLLTLTSTLLIVGFAYSQEDPGGDQYTDDFLSPSYLNQKPLGTAKAVVVVNPDYQVGIDDILDISVIKPEPIMSTVTVAPDGTITFPYIGNVQVKGLTLPKIQDEIQKRLAGGYMEYPVVSVSLRQTRSKKFIIYGQVFRPGAYPVDENMTLLRAITEAGGFVPSGSTGKVKVLRPKTGGTDFNVIESDITSILNGTNRNIPILAEDTIVVTVDKFFVYGQVNRPGAYPIEDDMTLLRALTLAGGFIESGSTGKVKLLRPQSPGSEFKVVETDIKAILNGAHQNVPVLAGDTIVVSVDKFFVYGQVNRPGAYPVEENMTLLHAITQAGGFIQSGSTGRVKLFRPKTAESEFQVIESDIRAILSAANNNVKVLPGDTIVVSADKFFVSGQVNRPGAYPVEENMTLLQAITLAGGFMEFSSTGTVKLLRPKPGNSTTQTIESDITSVLNGANQNVTVLAGDTIVVSAEKFYVYGEVMRPGMYPLEANTTALTAISMGGGFSKFGSAARVKILRMNEKTGTYDNIKVNLNDVMAGNSKSDVILKPRDIVVVSEGVF